MAIDSNIEWTDTTWNPVRGCTKVSPGCANCYAETFAERFRGLKGHPYEQGFDLRLVPTSLRHPLTWSPKLEECARCMGSGSKNDHVSCGDCGGLGRIRRSRRIFVNSMSDLFHEDVPDAFIAQAFGIMALTSTEALFEAPPHVYQILTKRIERAVYLLGYGRFQIDVGNAIVEFGGRAAADKLPTWPLPLPNVWIGPSVENQAMADARLNAACDLADSGWHVMISAEPLLGPVVLSERFLAIGAGAWVIAGGESGAGARGFEADWATALGTQCEGAGMPFFLKQLGARARISGVPLRLHHKKGGDPVEWPGSLANRRAFPAGV